MLQCVAVQQQFQEGGLGFHLLSAAWRVYPEHSADPLCIPDIIGCPHQEGIDYQGQWCPVCEFWKGRDRFTGERVH